MFKLKKEPFAHVFFHDIKNKLGSVKFSISMLKNPKISELQKEKLLNSLLFTIEKTIDIFQDFIETERFKQAKFLKNDKFDLKSLIEEIIQELQIDIERKNLHVIVSLKEAEFIKTNKEWLKKALFNIIHNGIKYNKDNGDLFIRISKEKNGYLLTIRDTGIGMSEEEKKQVFKKYYTSGKEHGTGIGLNMSKAVIESIGGSIAIESEKDKGSKFYIYLPKTAKQIKIRRLAAALSTFVLFIFITVNYFYCFFPQKISVQKSNTSIIYTLENDITAIANKNDNIKIKAYKNLFGTKSKTTFELSKADIKINTSSNPITLIANGKIIKNKGTEFETIVDKNTLATSVYKGEISSGKIIAARNEGLIYKNNSFTKKNLPKKVSNIFIHTDKNQNIIISWISPYKHFILTLSRDKKFIEIPIMKYETSNKNITFDTLEDGRWYISLQSKKDNLFSIPEIKTFLSLRNYQKALKAYNKNDLTLADTLIDISLSTIRDDSYKPYLLKAKILLQLNKTKKALKFAKQAYNLNKNIETSYTLAFIYYKLKQYKKSIDLIKTINNDKMYSLMAYNYYHLGNFKKAKQYLYKTLEKNPKNKKALQYMIEIQKKENNKFLSEYFKKQLRKLNESK